MAWNDVVKVVASLAPTVASAIGGPLAGMAVTALESVFGITPAPEETVEQRQGTLASAIAGATPEQLQAVRKADQDFQVKMAELGFKNQEAIAALRIEDVQGARALLTATRSWVPAALTVVLTFGVFMMIGTLFLTEVPQANREVFYTLLGAVSTAWITSTHFWFGDTLSSGEKTQIIAKSSPVQE